MSISSNRYILISALLLISSVYAASNCNPSNCSASCTPSCSVNEVCTMSTMTTCGICPDSKCVSRAALGLPPIVDSSSSNGSRGNNTALIGGLVGGLLGGGLVIGALIFFFVRRDKKKPALPLAFRHGNISKRTMKSQDMRESNSPARQITSGIIPVTFIPPSATSTITTSNTNNRRTSTARDNDLEGQYQFSSAVHNQDNDDPFSDRPISNATSIMSTNTDYYRRSSIESQVGQQKATVVQATQALRARPTIMRVKTVRQADKLTRSGSIKSIRPEVQQNNSNTSNITVSESVVTSPTSLTSETIQESITTPTTAKSSTLPSTPTSAPIDMSSSTAAKETIASQGMDNPFDDKNEISHFTSIPSEKTSRDNKMDSLMSAPGDGEITIFWNGS